MPRTDTFQVGDKLEIIPGCDYEGSGVQDFIRKNEGPGPFVVEAVEPAWTLGDKTPLHPQMVTYNDGKQSSGWWFKSVR